MCLLADFLRVQYKRPDLRQYALSIQPTESKEFLPGALLDERVGQADVEGVPEDSLAVQESVDRTARTAGDDVLFYRHDYLVVFCQL